MAKNPEHPIIRGSTWERRPLGRRVLIPEPPSFVISGPSRSEDGDALRRQALSDLAGLELKRPPD